MDLSKWNPEPSRNAWATGDTVVKPRAERKSALVDARKYLSERKAAGRPVPPLSEQALEEVRALRAKDATTYSIRHLSKIYGVPQAAMLVELNRLDRLSPEQLAQDRRREFADWEASLSVEEREREERKRRAHESAGLLKLLEERRAKGEELVPSEETRSAHDAQSTTISTQSSWAVPPERHPTDADGAVPS
jgi:hypothetical protein